MRNINFIYYGILFYFLYSQIYEIVSSMLIIPILYFEWSIHIIPIILMLLIVSFGSWFYRMQKFHRISFLFILTIVFLSLLVSYFSIPERFYLVRGNSLYDVNQQSVITNYISICRVINTLVIITISWSKYRKHEITENQV